MSMNKVRNYNMSYELLLDAVNEYEKFITGGGLNNQLFAYGMSEDIFGQRIEAFTNPEMSAENTVFKELGTRILDRTTGAFVTSKVVKGKAVKKVSIPSDIHKYIEIHHESANGTPFEIKADRDLAGRGYYTDAETPLENSLMTIASTDVIGPVHYITTMSPDVFGDMVPWNPDDEEGTKEGQTEEDKKYIYTHNVTKAADARWETPATNRGDLDEPHRYTSPSLAAYVMKHSKLNMSAKKSNHFSVFFNAITPLDMSRCTPYINIVIMTQKTRQDSNHQGLNNVSYLRFLRGAGDDTFVLDDAIGLNMAAPQSADGEPNFFELADMNFTTQYAYMDLFTAPQTMANPGINSAGSFDFIDNSKRSANPYNTSPILDPITPFLTLNSLNISISGAGYGIMASKVGKMSLTLHDRSRLKELAPLLASDKFSTTKMRIEFGWTHPDSGPTSKNTIGNYLEGLRDIGIYQLHGSDFSFSDGNTVNIDLKLSCSGWNESKTVPAACGLHTPLFIFKDYVDRALENYEQAVMGKLGAKKMPEVRQALKVRQRTAKSPMAIIPYETTQRFYESIKTGAKDEIIASITEMLGIQSPGEGVSNDDLLARIETSKGAFTAEQKTTVTKQLFAKLYSAKPGATPDPFCASFISECDDTDKVVQEGPSSIDVNSMVPEGALDDVSLVTLGKLIMSFIGSPLATCGLYDEVQVMFYPMNHHAAGARKHTTASFPINYNAFETAMKKTLSQQTGRVTINAVFAMLEKLVRDTNSPVYGFKGLDSDLEAFKKLEFEDKVTQAQGYYKELNAEHPNLEDGKEKQAVQDYTAHLASQLSTAKADSLERIYSSDGVNIPSEPKFIKPNISMFFEVVPVIEKTEEVELGTGGDKKWDMNFKVKKVAASDGLKVDNSILRVHIYDEESVSNPTALTMGSGVYEGTTGELIGGNELAMKDFGGDFDEKIVKVTDSEQVTKFISNMSFGEVKQFLKRAYPSITYGASTGTVNSIQVNGNTSGQLSDVLMAEAYGQNLKSQTDSNEPPSNFEEVMMFPGSITVNMMGMPLIFMGENIFIDFNTDTSLDNLYIVKSVNHSLGAGKFTTSVDLVSANQGAVKSFRNNLIKKTRQIIEGEDQGPG